METAKQQAEREKAEAIAKLREMLPPGSRVGTVLRHVSRSGMIRCISPVVVEGGEVLDVSWLVSRVLGLRVDRDKGGLRVSGAGMDMGFHVVYELSFRLYGKDGGPEALRHYWI